MNSVIVGGEKKANRAGQKLHQIMLFACVLSDDNNGWWMTDKQENEHQYSETRIVNFHSMDNIIIYCNMIFSTDGSGRCLVRQIAQSGPDGAPWRMVIWPVAINFVHRPKWATHIYPLARSRVSVDWRTILGQWPHITPSLNHWLTVSPVASSDNPMRLRSSSHSAAADVIDLYNPIFADRISCSGLALHRRDAHRSNCAMPAKLQ